MIKFKLKIIVFLFLLCTFVFGDETKTNILSELKTDFEKNIISQGEFIGYQLMALKNHRLLPEKYKILPASYTRDGTALIASAQSMLPFVSQYEKNLLTTVLGRPDKERLPLSITSPSGLFRIHYIDAGPDSASDFFISEAAKAYDAVYDFIIGNLGYNPPPNDLGIDGPEWDVYVYNVSDYGYSTAEYAVPSERYPYAYSSFTEIDNDFKHTFTKGLDALYVTAAHEFFHMVQIGYRSYTTTELPCVWLLESCSTWMEDVAYDDVNDYLQYLPGYFSSLNVNFIENNMYGFCVFFHMLEKKYQINIVRQIWQEFSRTEALNAVDNTLHQYGSSLSVELSEHAIWNYFTGERANAEKYYDEGEFYPMVKSNGDFDFSDKIKIDDRTDLLTSKFFKIQPLVYGKMVVQPKMQNPESWLYTLIVQSFDGSADYSTCPATMSRIIPQVSASSEVWLLTTNIKKPATRVSNIKENFAFYCDRGDSTLFKPGIISIFPNPFEPEKQIRGVQISIRLTRDTNELNLYILNENGQSVFNKNLGFQASGDLAFIWDGYSNDDIKVPSGLYFVMLDCQQDISPKKFAIIR